MDCDDVMLALADRERRTLTDREETGYHRHLSECDDCRALSVEADDHWRWIARLPEDAFDHPGGLALPVVDPVVFDVDRELFAGGMGRITKATDRRLGREVAIKEVLEPRLRARFEREAMITARLQHPAIVPIYEAGTWPNGSAFYTMRLVWGGTLATAIAKARTMTERLALLPHVVAVTEALAYAHSQRIIHRDLKPGNVLVGEFGETVVIDWGLAKELDRAIDDDTHEDRPGPTTNAELTRVGAVLGTPGFMSFEQATGDTIDERADVYALGAILYNVLTGVAPYYDKHGNGDSDRIIEAALLHPPTPIGDVAPDAPADLRVIVERAMARDKGERYPTAKEMSEELRRFQAGKLIAREYGLGELLMRWVRRHRTAITVGAFALFALAVVAVVAFVNIGSSRDAEREARQTAETALGDVSKARTQAEASVAALLEEQGRLELLTRDPERALAYLDAAYQRGRRSVALSQMLADATRDLDLIESTIELSADPTAIAFTGDGDVVVVDKTRRVSIWRAGAMRRSFSAGDTGHVFLDPTGRSVGTLANKTLVMWNVADGSERWRAAGDDHAELVFDATGTRVAMLPTYFIVGPHGPPEVRAVDTGALIGRLELPGDLINKVAFGRNGEIAASGQGTNLVRVWSTAPRFTPIATFAPDMESTTMLGPSMRSSGGADLLFAAAWGNGRTRLITVVARETRRWDLLGQPRSRTLTNHHKSIAAVAISPDGEVIASGDDAGLVRLIDLEGETFGQARDIEGMVRQLAFSADGAVLAGVGRDERIYVWDTVSLGLRRQIDAHPDGVKTFALDRAGPRLATAGDHDKRVRVWRVPAGRRLARIESGAIAVMPAQWVSGTSGHYTVRSLVTGAVLHEAKLDTGSTAPFRASRDGTRVLQLDAEDTVVIDPTLATFRALAMPGRVRMSADGRYAFAVGATKQRERLHALVVEVETGKPIVDVDLEDRPTRPGDYDIAPDGSRIVVAFADAIEEWRLSGGHRTIAVAARGERPKVRFDPNGTRLALFGDRLLVLADAATGTPVMTFETKLDISQVGFGAGGVLFAARAESTGQVELWTTHGRLVMRVDASAYAFSEDGARFATGTEDGTIRIWDVATGREVARLAGHTRRIAELAFSRDGTRLISLSDDHFASLWDVHLEQRQPAEIAELTARFAPYTIAKTGDLIPR